MKIGVIGTGYVGLVTGTCFAETGNDVVCVDTIQEKIDCLKGGKIPFYEPGLEDLVQRNMKEKRLSFTMSMEEAVKDAEITFICVGTPSKADGSANLDYVMTAAEQVARINAQTVIAIKSTVPVGTNDCVREHLEKAGHQNLSMASNPEFLREGAAVQDCMLPDRVVVGTNKPELAELFKKLYAPFIRTGNPLFIMDIRSAELTKYAANSLLAMRISFMNEISMICDKVGADITKIRQGVGADRRIGPQYLFPSVGFGGSCFPKDVRAMVSLAKEKGVKPRLLNETLEVNEAQKHYFADRVIEYLGGDKAKGKHVAMWGLAFKAKTDDVRESPALTVVDRLLDAGIQVTVYDPVAISNVKADYGDRLLYAEDSYMATEGAEALLVMTEWNQFRHPNFGKVKLGLKSPVVFDGRNLYEPEEMKVLGFEYFSIGRPEAN